MVPQGGYTVTNSPTLYAYPAPSHDIRSSRGAIFALKLVNLGGLRNLLCLHFLFKQTSAMLKPLFARRRPRLWLRQGHASRITVSGACTHHAHFVWCVRRVYHRTALALTVLPSLARRIVFFFSRVKSVSAGMLPFASGKSFEE